MFTVPGPIAQIALQNKAVVYGILFSATAETLLTLAADPRHLGAAIGFIAVLHTWGQTVGHHPHLHCVVPGGGLSPDGTQWIACRPGFFLPVRVLSRRFRRVCLHQLQEACDAQHLRFTGSLAALANPAPSPRIWPRPARPSGSSTRSDRLPALTRCSTTSGATPIGGDLARAAPRHR